MSPTPVFRKETQMVNPRIACQALLALLPSWSKMGTAFSSCSPISQGSLWGVRGEHPWGSSLHPFFSARQGSFWEVQWAHFNFPFILHVLSLHSPVVNVKRWPLLGLLSVWTTAVATCQARFQAISVDTLPLRATHSTWQRLHRDARIKAGLLWKQSRK